MTTLTLSCPQTNDFPAAKRVLLLGERTDASLATLTITSSGPALFAPRRRLSPTYMTTVPLWSTTGRHDFNLVVGAWTVSTASAAVSAYGFAGSTRAVSVALTTPMGVTWSRPTAYSSSGCLYVGTYRPMPGGGWTEMPEPVTVTGKMDASGAGFVELTGYFAVGAPLVHYHALRSTLVAVVVAHRRAADGSVRSVATGVGPVLSEHERWLGILRGTNLRSVTAGG